MAPDRWEIKGYWLAPYCVEHLIKLQALDHPILKGEVPTPAEVMVFLRVCHERRDDLYHIQPNWVDVVNIWKMKGSTKFYKSMLDDIAAYITDYSAVPKMFETADGKKQENNPAIPDLLSLISLLICKTSITEKEALRMPIGKAVWYSVAVARAEGVDVKTISTDIEENAERDKKGAEEHAARVKEMMRLAMVNGKIPTKKIR